VRACLLRLCQRSAGRYSKGSEVTGRVSAARQRLANRLDMSLPANQRKLAAADIDLPGDVLDRIDEIVPGGDHQPRRRRVGQPGPAACGMTPLARHGVPAENDHRFLLACAAQSQERLRYVGAAHGSFDPPRRPRRRRSRCGRRRRPRVKLPHPPHWPRRPSMIRLVAAIPGGGIAGRIRTAESPCDVRAVCGSRYCRGSCCARRAVPCASPAPWCRSGADPLCHGSDDPHRRGGLRRMVLLCPVRCSLRRVRRG
jgi:hypothetical protein